MDLVKFEASKYKSKIATMVQSCDSLRKGENAVDINFDTYLKKRDNISLSGLFDEMGIDPSMDTISNLFDLPDPSVRWLVPEIFREALRLGLRKAPIWPGVVAAEQSIKALQIVAPSFNMSDAGPQYVGQAETIPLGELSFQQKTVKTRKIGKGVKIPYEVKNFVSLNIVSIFLQDLGIKFGQAIDALLVNILINGEQADGSESAPTVGVTTPTTVTYADILRIWVRMSRIGRLPSIMIGGETAALATLNLTEFKTNQFGGTAPVGVPTASNIKLKTAIPANTEYHIHGAMPANQQVIIDPAMTVIKYNSQPLLVESERLVANQTEATYATLTTGFGIVFRDARVVLDSTLDFASTGAFPSYMNVDAIESVSIQD